MRQFLTLFLGFLAGVALVVLVGCSDNFHTPRFVTVSPPGQEDGVLFVRDNAAGGEDLFHGDVSRVRARALTDLGSDLIDQVWTDVVFGYALYKENAVNGDGNWYAVSTDGKSDPKQMTTAGVNLQPQAWVASGMLVIHETSGGISNLWGTPLGGDSDDAVNLTQYESGTIDENSLELSGGNIVYEYTDAGVTHVETTQVTLDPEMRRLTRQGIASTQLYAVTQGHAVLEEYDAFDTLISYGSFQLGAFNASPFVVFDPAPGDLIDISGMVGGYFVYKHTTQVDTDLVQTYHSVDITSGMNAELASFTGDEASVVTEWAGDTLVFRVLTSDNPETQFNEANARYVSAFVDGSEAAVEMTANANHTGFNGDEPENEFTFHAVVDDMVVYTRTSEPGKVWAARIGESGSEREVASELDNYSFFATSDYRVILSVDTEDNGITFRDLYSVEFLQFTNVGLWLTETGVDNNDDPIAEVGTDRGYFVYQRGTDIYRVQPGVANSELMVASPEGTPTIHDISYNGVVFTDSGNSDLFHAWLTNGVVRNLTGFAGAEELVSVDLVTSTHVVFTVDDGAERIVCGSKRDPGASPAHYPISQTLGTVNNFQLGY